MRPARLRCIGIAMAIVWGLCASALPSIVPARASDLPDAFDGAGVDPQPGAQVPADAPFTDETGRAVRLADFLGGAPVVLAPVYYNCPNLCGSTLADLATALERMPLTPGRDFQVVAVSIDPREGPADAARAKRRALAGSERPELAASTHFLTGPGAAALTQAIGFRYRWDDSLQQYAHVSGVALLTPKGRLARWLSGVGLEPEDLRLAVAEAGRGGIGGLADRFLLLCYHYDPATGRYGSLVDRLLKIGGGLTVLAIGGSVGFALFRERRRRAHEVV